MRTGTIMIAALACAVACAQQETRAPEGENERTRARDGLILPIPMSSPGSADVSRVPSLTPEQKANRAIRNTIAPRAIVNRALIAGWSHLLDSPEEWSGNMDGYGQRFASRMGRLAVRQGVQLGADVAFGIEPRYDRCNCTGFKARTAHAWKRIVISRRDNGGEIFAISNFAGAYVPPMITDQWEPASRNTWDRKLTSGTQFLAFRGATNMLREFWPEIARKIKLGRFARSGGD